MGEEVNGLHTGKNEEQEGKEGSEIEGEKREF